MKLVLTLLALWWTPVGAFVSPSPFVRGSWSLHATQATTDTPAVLPTFANKEEYLAYMEQVSSLPKGFATGTANGKFVSVEAPGLGPLPIRATVIYLTEGPTDNWAAVFTKNKVGC